MTTAHINITGKVGTLRAANVGTHPACVRGAECAVKVGNMAFRSRWKYVKLRKLFFSPSGHDTPFPYGDSIKR